MASPIANSFVMLRRSYRLSTRNVDGLMTGIALPVILMLVFVVLFGGAIDTGTAYVTYVVPAVMVLTAAFGAATVAVGVSGDMKGGIIDRFRSLPIAPSSVLTGHVGATLIRNLVASAIVIVVAVAIGFRPSAGVAEWIVVIGLLSLFILAVAWFSTAIGLVANSPEAASGASFLFMFLPYVSSGFVPVETLPAWLQGFAQHQPATPLIESVRALLTGGDPGLSLAVAMAWWGGLTLVGFVLASRLFARRTR
jgi:ABC-2 type transport system permease protein